MSEAVGKVRSHLLLISVTVISRFSLLFLSFFLVLQPCFFLPHFHHYYICKTDLFKNISTISVLPNSISINHINTCHLWLFLFLVSVSVWHCFPPFWFLSFPLHIKLWKIFEFVGLTPWQTAGNARIAIAHSDNSDMIFM